MTTAQEHHAKAGRACAACKPRTAIKTSRGITRRGSTTHRTIECFGLHTSYPLIESCAEVIEVVATRPSGRVMVKGFPAFNHFRLPLTVSDFY